MFSIVEMPELYINQGNAIRLASKVTAWGYRARIHNQTNRLDRSERGYAVAVYSNNGFEGYAHDL